MNEKIKQMITELLLRQSQLKMEIKTRDFLGSLSDEKLSELLDEIQEIETLIEKLKKFDN